MKDQNYYDTFIAVSEDCPASAAEIPPMRGEQKSVANLQFEMLINHPYTYTQDDVLFEVYALRNGIADDQKDEMRIQFFSKGQACLRTSPLGKRYGWGQHHNAQGKIALYAMESEEYAKFVADPSLKQVKAVRSKR